MRALIETTILWMEKRNRFERYFKERMDLMTKVRNKKGKKTAPRYLV